MRLDVFLKISRLITRRSLANAFCDRNLVLVNNAYAKPSKSVNVGDTIEIRRPSETLTVKVENIPETKQVSKEIARMLYSIVRQTFQEEIF